MAKIKIVCDSSAGLTDEEIKKYDDELNEIVSKLNELMLAIPNIPDESVPYGSDSDENVEVRRYLEPTKFDFEPKAHWDLGLDLNIFDWERAGKITGARFTVYKNWGAKLERAIMNFMLDTHAQSNYTEVFPPFMVNRDSMIGTGQLPKFEEDMYAVKGTDYYLVPTAEVPVTNLHRGEILDEKQEKMIIGTNIHARASQLNQKMQMEEFMFLGFRMTEGIEKSRFYRKFGLPVDFVYQETLKKLTSEGLLIETPTRLYLTEKGMDLNNYVAAQFLL